MASRTSGAEVIVIVDYLKQLIERHSDLMSPNDQLRDLSADLDMLKFFISEQSERLSNNAFLEEMISGIRELVRQAEDTIETYLSHKFKRETSSSIRKALFAVDYKLELRNLAKQILEIRENLKKMRENYGQVGVVPLSVEETTTSIIRGKERRDEKGFFGDEDDMVGCEDEVEKIIDLLIGGTENLEVISITGMPGVGKTTLAKRVFSDPRVEYQFFPRLFVCVSYEFSKREVFLNILTAFSPNTDGMFDKMSTNDLAKEVSLRLKGRRFFIVIDDVWTKEAWDDLKVVFPQNEKCHSKVLVTTRNHAVAFYACPKLSPHTLRLLVLEESRELLQRKVFGENKCPIPLENLIYRILEQCPRLPLAIVVVAGILRNCRDRIDWWHKVAEDLIKNSTFHEESQIRRVISVSFNQLPHRLKLCFLYLGVFRVDFEIPVWILLRLWVAEGLIQEVEGIWMEDVAAEYLEELVDRNLVIVMKRRSDGTVKTCRVHDMLLQFCKEQAKKENLFQEINRSNLESFSPVQSSLENSRRLCINSSVLEILRTKPKAKNARSLLSFAKEDFAMPAGEISSILRLTKLLRILDVRSVQLPHFPAALLSLFLLRYLAVSCELDILPEKLRNLCNLQTLIIQTTSSTLEIMADISEMPLLSHLHVNASTNLQKFKGKSSANKNLQTLSRISPESCSKELFEGTPNLKKLGVYGNIATMLQGNLFEVLLGLEHLENLKLLNDNGSSKLHNLPNLPRNLTRLTLSNTWLDWKHMSTLGKLENLEVLKLKDNAFMGRSWVTEDGGFKSLKVLHIGATDLVTWEASENHFPNLVSLLLRNCRDLEPLPLALAGMPRLRTIDLYCSNSMLASTARAIREIKQEMGDDYFKVIVYPPDQ